jgi:FKBP-type peptidyl-prolyl cis-trans isomerase
MRFLALALIVCVGTALAQSPAPSPAVTPGAAAGTAAAPSPSAAPSPRDAAAIDALFKDTKSKVSYCIGVQMGTSLRNQPVEVDPKTLAEGIQEAFEGKTAKVTVDEARMVINAYLREKMKELSEKNLKDGAAFLEENKKKDGVKVTASGLQYKVVKEGTGPKPKATDTVLVHYRGTLIDGKEFDSSHKRGQPAELGVSQVIPGWTEALQQMGVGAKWNIFVPGKMAYGERPAGPIPPNSTLLFEIELIEIKGDAAHKDDPKKGELKLNLDDGHGHEGHNHGAEPKK